MADREQAYSHFSSRGPRRGGGRDGGGGGRDDYRGGRDEHRGPPPREEIPVPDEPPFEVYVGNLPYDIIQSDVEYIFQTVNLPVKNVRMVRDRDTDKFKGSAFVEFEDREGLIIALGVDGAEVGDRQIRVNVAGRKGESRRGGGRGGGGGDKGGGPGRDMGRGGPRDAGFGAGRGRPGGDRGPPQEGGGGGGRGGGPGGGYDRGESRGGDRGGDRGYRGGGGGGSGGAPPTNSGSRPRTGDPKLDEEFKESTPEDSARRPKLNLQKRSVDAPVGQLAEVKRDIFGGAKPREEVVTKKMIDLKVEDKPQEPAA